MAKKLAASLLVLLAWCGQVQAGVSLNFRIESAVRSFAFSTDGGKLAVATADGLWLFDLKEGERVWFKVTDKDNDFGACDAAVFGPGDKVLFLRCGKEDIRALDAKTGTAIGLGGLPPSFEAVEPKVPDKLTEEGGNVVAATQDDKGRVAILVERPDQEGQEKWRIRLKETQLDWDEPAFLNGTAIENPKMAWRPGARQLAYTCREGLIIYDTDRRWNAGLLRLFKGGHWLLLSGRYAHGDIEGLRHLCDDWDDPEFVPDSIVNVQEVASNLGFKVDYYGVKGVAGEMDWRAGRTELCADQLKGVPSREEIENELVALMAEAGSRLEVSDHGHVQVYEPKDSERSTRFWLVDMGRVHGFGDGVDLICRKVPDYDKHIKCVSPPFGDDTVIAGFRAPEGKGERMRQLFQWLFLRRPEYGPKPRAPW